MNRLQAVGGYLRFNSALPQKLVNMIALLTSRHYTQQYEWDGNYPLSLKSGLSADIANAIGDGRVRREQAADAIRHRVLDEERLHARGHVEGGVLLDLA